MMLLARRSPECWQRSQEAQRTPELGFFDSDNFQLLESTQKRIEADEQSARIRIRKERSRRKALVDRSASAELGYYSELFRADGNPKPRRPRAPPQTFFGLRRPLNAQEHRLVKALPAYEKDHKEWADKPYSTVFAGLLGYRGKFPLLMHINSDSEDKDVTVVQTETRRKSMVTTNYASGTIKLQDEEEEMKFAVFPILHRVVETDSEEDSSFSSTDKTSGTDADDDDGDNDRPPRNRPPPLLPQDVLERLQAIAVRSGEQGDEDSDESEEAEPPPGWLEHRATRMHADRRLSITTRPCPEKPRVLKRRSLDFGALFYHHEVVEGMDVIAEDEDDETLTPADPSAASADGPVGGGVVGAGGNGQVQRAGTWAMESEAKERDAIKNRDLAALIRRAEKEMEQMDFNLHKLEDFLKQPDSDSD